MSSGGCKEFKNLFDGETEYHDSATGWFHNNNLLISKTKTKSGFPNLRHGLLPGPIYTIE